ncbi:MAG TPA: protease modulator HflK [Candidatus Aquilonibacter sp.]|nr:protease modulator HflK [Candidatus Aquilonibacter sp.]
MSDEHEHHDHDHGHSPAPETGDAGSQALAEALRSSFAIVKIVMLLMVAAFFCSGFFQVGPSEKAIILRFGKPVGAGQKALLSSGLHWSFPYPIDEVVKIPITESQKVSSNNGWYFTTPEAELSGEEIPPGPSLDPTRDGYVITADRNIIHTRATLYYHIEDPIRYVFNFTSASNTVQNILDNALLYTAAHFDVDDALYNDEGGFQEAVEQRVRDLADRDQLGIVVDNCEVQNIPPRQLADVFAQVTTSRETRDETLNTARSDANTTLLQASAQATDIVNEAETARTKYVASVDADAKRFSDLLPKYESNPDLFVQTTLLPAIGDALTHVQDKMFLPLHANGKPAELRLMLNRELPQPKPEAQSP